MLELLAESLAIGWTSMIGVYWICLIVGGGLVLISVLSGHHGGDAHAGISDVGDVGHVGDFEAPDMHFDTDALHATDAAHVDLGADATDATAAGAELSQWLSLRFAIYFAAIFGAVGVVLHSMTDISAPWILGLAGLGGFGVGQAVQQTMVYVRRTSGDSSTRPQDYVDKLARVTIPIEPPEKGEIALQVRGTRRYISAASCGKKQQYQKGEEVVVVNYRAGVAEVIGRDECV